MQEIKKGVSDMICKSCIHYFICKKFNALNYQKDKCELYEHKELYLKLPCQIGEPVFVIRKMNQNECIKAGITPVEWNINNRTIHSIDYQNRPYTIIKTTMKRSYYRHFGKTVFTDYNEALKQYDQMKQ